MTVIGRLRKDAALRNLQSKTVTTRVNDADAADRRNMERTENQLGQASRPSPRLADGQMHRLRQNVVTKLYKTFLATYRPVGGRIRVVIVEEDHDWYPFFSTDANATAVGEIIEAFADRATIEQDFHDVKEVYVGCGPAANLATSGATWQRII